MGDIEFIVLCLTGCSNALISFDAVCILRRYFERLFTEWSIKVSTEAKNKLLRIIRDNRSAVQLSLSACPSNCLGR